MWNFVRRVAPSLALGAFAILAGCEIPDRPVVRSDDGANDPTFDAGFDVRRDVSVSDSPTDGSVAPDVPRDGTVADGILADTTLPPRDGVAPDTVTPPRDAPPDVPPSTCTSGGACVPSNACHQGESVCSDAGSGTCRDTQRNQSNGTPCDKGVCLDGVCQACAAGTMCDVPNQPCRSGTIECSSGSAVCVASGNKPNGASCGTGTVCQEGLCKPCVTGAACTPTNACHEGKLDCSGAAPVCNDTGVNVTPGSTCGTDKVCAPDGTCVTCVANAMCTVASNACRTGTTTCNTGAPVCAESGNTPNGTPCGTDKVCSAGACVACTVGLSCVPANPCHSGATVCSPAVGCNDTGSNLTDGTPCGQDKVCSMGTCTTCVTGATCSTGNACKKGTTSCTTGVSKCVESGDQPDGASCGTNQVCSKGVCGMCNQGSTCVPTDTCHKGTLDCSSGVPVCTDTGMAQTNGTPCGTKRFCYSGMCSSCNDGATCTLSNAPCKNAAIACTTGQEVCTETGNKAAGVSCGAAQTCTAGKVTAAAVCNSSGQCPTPAVTNCTTGVCNGNACLECGSGESVCNGACCAAGKGCCLNACVDLTTTSNCGSCGNTCGNGEICNASKMCELQTWCATQTKPSGVASADYQCLDFDKGMPPSNVWVPSLTAQYATLAIATDQIKSPPSSLQATSSAPDETDPAMTVPEADLTWTTSGNFISKVSLAADIYPQQLHGFSGGPVELTCITFGTARACLVYSLPDNASTWALTYDNSALPPRPGWRYCDISGFLEFLQWDHLDFSLASDGNVTISVNGVSSTCYVGSTLSSGTASVRIGSKGYWGQPQAGNYRYDNVVTYVQR